MWNYGLLPMSCCTATLQSTIHLSGGYARPPYLILQTAVLQMAKAADSYRRRVGHHLPGSMRKLLQLHANYINIIHA